MSEFIWLSTCLCIWEFDCVCDAIYTVCVCLFNTVEKGEKYIGRY